MAWRNEPWFWTDDGVIPALIRTMLTPASSLYVLGQKIRAATTNPYICPSPVICVGAASIGGAGKTPTALTLAELLATNYKNICFLTRGYRGDVKGPTFVADHHTSNDVGDEALLLAQRCPTIVSANRAAGAKLAAENGADLIIMDDGYQNPTLKKDVSILLVDDSGLDQRQRVFPAGRLREPIARAAARADIIVRVSTTKPGAPITQGEEWPSKSSGAFFTTARTIPTRTIDSSRKYLAFSGIARPQRFIASLKGAGLDLVDAVSFPDHHPFSETELSMLRKRAADIGATLITTEKDFVRLSQEQQDAIATFGIEIAFDQATQLVQRISETIGANRGMTSSNV